MKRKSAKRRKTARIERVLIKWAEAREYDPELGPPVSELVKRGYALDEVMAVIERLVKSKGAL